MDEYDESLKIKDKKKRFEVGAIYAHEYYKIKGFLTIFSKANAKDLVSLAKSDDPSFRKSMMAKLAVQYLVDDDIDDADIEVESIM